MGELSNNLRHKSQQGFTLLEVLISLTIMVIISTIAFGRYSNRLSRMNLLATSQETQAMFELAREYAVSTGQEVVVSINRVEETLAGLAVVQHAPTTRVIEDIEFGTRFRVRASEDSTAIVFRKNQPIQHLLNQVPQAISRNYTLEFTDAQNVTSDVVVFYRSGSVQIFKAIP